MSSSQWNPAEVKSFKIVILGDRKVGKSTLRKKLCHNIFTDEYIQTDSAVSNTFKQSKPHIEAWDIPGDKVHVQRTHFENTNAFVICYSDAVENSFENVNWWAKKIKEYTSGTSPIMLLSLQSDNNPLSAELSRQKLLDKAKEISATISFAVSAKDDINVIESFTSLAEALNNKLKIIKEIDESLRIYNALYNSQTSFYKKDNHWENIDMSDKEALLEKMNEHALVLHSRTHKTKELLNKYPHWDEPQSVSYPDDYVRLITEGYEYAHSKSGIFKTAARDMQSITIESINTIATAEPESRLGKLINGLKRPMH